MNYFIKLEKIAVKKGIGATAVVAATNPITVVACVFNPVLAVAVVAGAAATVKACEAPLADIEVDLDTIASVDYFANLEAKVSAQDVSIQYNEYPEAKTTEEIYAEVDAELEAMRKELGLV
ncbi:MAG: hypothetical protein ACRDBG_20690 [Waterburya sp.]